MARSGILSVRLTSEARDVLAASAPAYKATGASALARDILERWAADTKQAQIQAGIERAVAYMDAHPEGWTDDPDDFFPGASKE
jgi:hypothetical protein